MIQPCFSCKYSLMISICEFACIAQSLFQRLEISTSMLSDIEILYSSCSYLKYCRYLESVNNGLLFYLQTNQTQVILDKWKYNPLLSNTTHVIYMCINLNCQGVAIQHADLAGLVMRRNELATNILIASSTQHLPPMLQVCFTWNECGMCMTSW